MRYIFLGFGLFIAAFNISAQVDDFCTEVGYTPSLDSPFAQIPYIYGRISIKGLGPGGKAPNITITMVDSNQSTNRWTVGKSGNYCFKLTNRGTTLLVEVNGVEVARRTIATFGPSQQREDFEIDAQQLEKTSPPGVVSAKFSHPPNPKTAELYKNVSEAESRKDSKKNIEYLKEIVSLDPADFIAWAKLGLLYFNQNSLSEAEAAFRKTLGLKVEYTPAWVNMGMIRMNQKQYAAAVEIYKHAAELEPRSPRIYQLLGEAYLQNKQGSLGAEALNKALELDPLGMAECHLQLAHLYQLAKVNKLATKEYKMFLTKVPDYKDKDKLEEFIRKNPE